MNTADVKYGFADVAATVNTDNLTATDRNFLIFLFLHPKPFYGFVQYVLGAGVDVEPTADEVVNANRVIAFDKIKAVFIVKHSKGEIPSNSFSHLRKALE